jgi:putative membrane protein
MHNMLPIPSDHERLLFKQLISMYPYSLRSHLLRKSTESELFDMNEFEQELSNIDPHMHIPNQVLNTLYHNVVQLHRENIICAEELIILNEDLRILSDVCGGCERIKNTPIPYSYGVFLKKFIFFYVMSLPFALIVTLSYYAIPVVVFIFYVLASLELIAEEIEDPFGEDVNDLPMKRIADGIKKTVAEVYNKQWQS